MKAHFIWFWPEEVDRGELKFSMYLSLKSFLKSNPDKELILHTNRDFSGELFERIQDRITIKYANAPTEIFGNKISHLTHASDVYRLKILLEEGGIYSDFDTVTLRSFDPVLPKNGELVYSSCNFPKEKFSNGLIISGPGNPFIEKWLEGYKNYKKKWGYNSIEVSSQLLETDLGKKFTNMVDPEYFYPIKWTTAKSTQLKFDQKRWDSLLLGKTISYHLYNHQTKEAIEKVNENNYEELSSTSTVAALAKLVLHGSIR